MKRRLMRLYQTLWRTYGPQGWWPVGAKTGKQTAADADRGYHPFDYSLPDTAAGRFEVAVGAILTQNTAWKNVEQALWALRSARLLSPGAMRKAPLALLRNAVRPSGYFNQKAKKLKHLADFFLKNGVFTHGRPPEREELLSLWGVGEETADSILLYAFHEPVFVVDAFTRRLLGRLGWAEEKASYREIQKMMQRFLPRERIMYNEFHALIVEHAKRFCRKKPACAGCPVEKFCPWPARSSG